MERCDRPVRRSVGITAVQRIPHDPANTLTGRTLLRGDEPATLPAAEHIPYTDRIGPRPSGTDSQEGDRIDAFRRALTLWMAMGGR